MITLERINAIDYPIYRVTDKGMGYVYILYDSDSQCFKIGATLNLKNRFRTLYKKYTFTWNVHCVLPCSNVWGTEGKLLQQYRSQKVKYRKDWFYLTDEDIESIMAVVK